MNNLSTYIIEKLRLNKYTEVNFPKYVLIYLNRDYTFSKKVVKDSFKDMVSYMDMCPIMNTHYAFNCSDEIVDELIDKFKKYNKQIKTSDVWEWIRDNGKNIREIKADEINDFRK